MIAIENENCDIVELFLSDPNIDVNFQKINNNNILIQFFLFYLNRIFFFFLNIVSY